MTEAVMNFYLIRWKQGKVTTAKIVELVTAMKITQPEADTILAAVA